MMDDGGIWRWFFISSSESGAKSLVGIKLGLSGKVEFRIKLDTINYKSQRSSESLNILIGTCRLWRTNVELSIKESE